MGTCHEFGPSIQEGCDHPMQATRADACTCGECGVVCHGRFPGCATVWARGPQAVHWKPQAAPGAVVARRVEPERGAPRSSVMTDGPPGTEEMAAALRRLVAEVGRLREDLDDQRVRAAETASSVAGEVRAAIAEELERAIQVDGAGGGVFRRLASALQPAPIDVDGLIRRLKSELAPAMRTEGLAAPNPETPGPPVRQGWSA